ncbi:Negative regulator of mitotic exit [Elasticomyces elasticus]|nr:Negative regulator of mitotic exit [Elasticomyces elasticus]
MSFLFKSSKKQPTAAGLPPATRSITSADGPQSSSSSVSQIPVPNGLASPRDNEKALRSQQHSPTPGTSVNNSMSSLNGAVEKNGRSLGGMTEKRSGPPSPEGKTLRERDANGNVMQTRMLHASPPADNNPYPWSQRQLHFTSSANPFPRYGAAVNAAASKDGGIYLMGGLINGSTVKGDLWMVEAGAHQEAKNATPSMSCYPVATTSEGPGPRVGHASLLVGNAFIVFGGDTKMDEGDLLDDTLYLLNTSTKQWSRALPAGPRPPGRYGHTLNILASKIYIFGGQVEGYFFNDLVAFDLNALQLASNRWEVLIQNTHDGGPPAGRVPPARTNHTMVTWNDRLYLFGGTDGISWFNDVWSYDPRTNTWDPLACIGYIPAAREGHAATLINDVMYIFGGRTEEGSDLGDLAAFRISSRRWYTFQNMGPSPSPRSGHSMTAWGKQVVVIGGEPSSAPRDPSELSLAYFLDTSKIRYPPDSQSQQAANERVPGQPVNERIQGHRRPSGGERSGIPQGRGMAREMASPTTMYRGSDSLNGNGASRLPRAAGPSGQLPSPQQSQFTPSGPPPHQQPPQPRALTNGVPMTNNVPSTRQPSRPERPEMGFGPPLDTNRAVAFERNANAMNPDVREASQSSERDDYGASTSLRTGQQANVQTADTNGGAIGHGGNGPTSPSFNEGDGFFDTATSPQPQVHVPTRYPPDVNRTIEPAALSRSGSKAHPQLMAHSMDRPEGMPHTPQDTADRQYQDSQYHERDSDEPIDSGLGSSPALTQQNDELIKELEVEKSRIAWMTSELALARKAGYQASPANGVGFDDPGADAFADDDRPLIEALLKMRSEITRVQGAIDTHAKAAAERIAETEKQRDAAVNEAVLAKAKLAAQSQGQAHEQDLDRSNEMNRRLASSLVAQAEMSRRNDSLIQELEAEKQARSLAEETTAAAEKRVTELDGHRQRNASEIESLRAELHQTQKAARDEAANAADAIAAHKLLSVDKTELTKKLSSAMSENQNHVSILSSLRQAVTASSDKSALLEQKLEDEKGHRDSLETKLAQLRAEHEDRTRELDTTSRRLRDAEEMGGKHAEEARTHRQAVLDGLSKVQTRDLDEHEAADERVVILKQQVEAANAMVRQNQAAADSASERLRKAEERIAGLEAYQEQASREGLSIRKQLQTSLKEVQSLHAEKAELQTLLQSQQLETNAIAVQHGALKDILNERNVNVSEARRSRGLDSPSSLHSQRFSTPDFHRVRDLELQLEQQLKSHEEVKASLEQQNTEVAREYEEKLTALDNDHQAAVKYLRGTEKMLSKMKQELQRVKTLNAEQSKEVKQLREKKLAEGQSKEMSLAWEQEREGLRKEIADVQSSLGASVSTLETQISTLTLQLSSAQAARDEIHAAHTRTQADLQEVTSQTTAFRSDLERLTQENATLDERARDAEKKVQLLLDQVESSVDNYRRQSHPPQQTPTLNGMSHGHSRSVSTESASTPIANHNYGHRQNDSITSTGNESIYSQPGSNSTHDPSDDPAGRDSMALDNLASELDALRVHWEHTKNYRHSDRGDGRVSDSLANWRRGLDLDEEGDEEGERSPATAAAPAGALGLGKEGKGLSGFSSRHG